MIPLAICYSLLSPSIQLCEAKHGPLVCEAGKCQTVAELQQSWKGHPEREVKFRLKLYGVEK